MPQSDYVPQLATLVKAPPSGDEWLHEIKYDGYRIGCRIRGGRISLRSRNGKDWTTACPEIVEAPGGQHCPVAALVVEELGPLGELMGAGIDEAAIDEVAVGGRLRAPLKEIAPAGEASIPLRV
jgi:hypothetical protein